MFVFKLKGNVELLFSAQVNTFCIHSSILYVCDTFTKCRAVFTEEIIVRRERSRLTLNWRSSEVSKSDCLKKLLARLYTRSSKRRGATVELRRHQMEVFNQHFIRGHAGYFVKIKSALNCIHLMNIIWFALFTQALKSSPELCG